MPLSESMKAAIVLSMAILFAVAMMAMATLALALVISNGLGALTSAVKAEAIGTYAGFGGFAGGMFEDTFDLD